MGFIKNLIGRMEAAKFTKQPEESNDYILDPFKLPIFEGPLDKFPQNRVEVYEIYGRPSKGVDKTKFTGGMDCSKFPKAKMHVAENLPGNWNSKPRLYMLSCMEAYFREALRRCDELGVLDYITKIGCYNHRNINFDSNKPLSYHSWGSAVDINGGSNKIKRGKIPPPFSRQWIELYPNGVPFQLVLAFKSVGFTWGGDWNNESWIEWIRMFGIGYDAPDDNNWPKGWKGFGYTDPMHFELKGR